jgi:hypothetical protein
MFIQRRQVAYFDPNHNKPFTALRTAVENGEGYLGKEAKSHDDLYDSARTVGNNIVFNLE